MKGKKMGIELREDLVMIERVEDKTPVILMVGDNEEPKKYHDLVVVQVGDAVSRFEPGDKVYYLSPLTLVLMDPHSTGTKTPFAMIPESAIYAREVK